MTTGKTDMKNKQKLRAGRHSLDRLVRPDEKRGRQIWDAATVATERGDEIAWRYEPEEVRLTLRQAARQWLNGLKNLEWNWGRTGLVMRPIKPGEPGYDDAPYEMSIVWHRDVMGPNIRHEPRPTE